MADEPGGWELKRALEQHRTDMREGFAQINARLDDMAKNTVTSREHQADMSRLNDRMTELAKDIEAERADRRVDIANEQKARKEAIAAEQAGREESDAALQRAMDRTGMWLRWIAASVAIPIVVVLLGFLLSKGGA